jgi:hypothetical protein
MYDTKHPLRSLGIMGPLVAVVIFVGNKFWPGLGIGAADIAPMIEAVDVVAGALLGIVGRWRATTEIKLKQ